MTWQKFFTAHRGTDDGATVARKIGASAATVSRWSRGTAQPLPNQVTAFARAYGANPLTGLVAAGYIDFDDVGIDAPAVAMPADLSEVSTARLLDELQRRLTDLRDQFDVLGRTSDRDALTEVVEALAERHLPPSNVVPFPHNGANLSAIDLLDDAGTVEYDGRMAADKGEHAVDSIPAVDEHPDPEPDDTPHN